MQSRLFQLSAHTQALMSAVESHHRLRNQPSAAVPCRQSICCQPSDLVPCCRAPSRHRHSPSRQRPILFARLRSLTQPFLFCRRFAATISRSSPFVAYLPLLCEPALNLSRHNPGTLYLLSNQNFTIRIYQHLILLSCLGQGSLDKISCNTNY